MHTKRFNTFLKSWLQFRVGAIPRLSNILEELEKTDAKSMIFLFFSVIGTHCKKCL